LVNEEVKKCQKQASICIRGFVWQCNF
jgi:hypothetical protein